MTSYAHLMVKCVIYPFFQVRGFLPTKKAITKETYLTDVVKNI